MSLVPGSPFCHCPHKTQGIDYFVQMHLDGAGVKDCDHWHDDAGERRTTYPRSLSPSVDLTQQIHSNVPLLIMCLMFALSDRLPGSKYRTMCFVKEKLQNSPQEEDVRSSYCHRARQILFF